MLIAKAPMRISLLGGTTDFTEYFSNAGKVGRVLGFTIDKYVYVYLLKQPESEEIKYRFTWRFTESVSRPEDIHHPVVKRVLLDLQTGLPLNIGTMADLPGRSGLGSSSAFCAGLLSVIEANNSGTTDFDAYSLAQQAIEMERIKLGEPGGLQDQYFTCLGGFRLIEFRQSGVTSPWVAKENSKLVETLNQMIVLVATGGLRDSMRASIKTQLNINSGLFNNYLDELSDLTLDAQQALALGDIEYSISRLAKLINESWELKKQITNHDYSEVDKLLEFGKTKGAIAGKLCGAGGAGYALFLVPPEDMGLFCLQFSPHNIIKISIVHKGTELVRL